MFALPSCATTSLSSARSSVLRPLRRRATLRRSLHLLSDFRFEQSDPDRFYGRLAEDTVRLIRDLQDGATGKALAGCRILDVGGGPGYFGRAFAAAWSTTAWSFTSIRGRTCDERRRSSTWAGR